MSLNVRVIKTSRIFETKDGDVPYYGYYAYWFVGQHRETLSFRENVLHGIELLIVQLIDGPILLFRQNNRRRFI